MIVRSLFMAVILAASSGGIALAQGTSPNTKADNAAEATATRNGSGSPAKPGATGSTVVTGDKSTVAGDSKATTDTRTGGGGAGNK